jgi:hypothetical protein
MTFLVAVSLFPPFWAGCSGANFGEDPRVAPSERAVIGAGGADRTTIALPDGQPFNIHIKTSRQNPRADGTADSGSTAKETGTASAWAEASNTGSATADFKIGHRMVNNAESPQEIVVNAAFKLSRELRASPNPDPKTLAQATLHLAVIDQRKQVHAKVLAVQATSDEAIESATTQERRSIQLTLEPEMSYDIVMYGIVEVAADEDEAASARLELEDLTMEIKAETASVGPSDPDASQ